jgi:hypothetical protein
MNQLELFLSWSTLTFEVALCVFVFSRRAYRVLPLFVTYTCVILAGTIGVWLTYEWLGISSLGSIYAYWGSVILNAVVRSLAIAELCRFGLQLYRGIWALVWRVLIGASLLLLIHTALDARGQPNQFAIYGMTLDRDLALASIVILAVLLLFRNYYRLALDPLQRGIAFGIGLICTVDVIGNSIYREIFTGYLYSWFLASQKALWPAMRPQVQYVNDLWSTVHLFAFMFTMGIWCFALREPVSAPTENLELLPANIYRELSPAINLRLATFNDRLVELLKP